MGEVSLDYVVPAADLAPFVTVFYHFRADVAEFADVERADHAQLRFRLSPGAGRYTLPDGAILPAPAIHVVGPTSGAMQTWAAGPVEVFGMGLTPAGWAALIRADASTFLDRVVDAAALFDAPVAEALAALRAAADRDAMVTIVEALLRRLIADADGEALAFIARVDGWLADAVSPSVPVLVAATGLSRRQVERRCNALYGAPPKVLARKYRALRAAVLLASGDTAADRIIAEGFYDQSHLIRELKRFTGVTPRAMREHPALLAQLTISRRRALGGQVHPIISDT